MSAADAAAEILRREQENPGSVPPTLLAKATQLAGQGPGTMRLPEQTIRGEPASWMAANLGEPAREDTARAVLAGGPLPETSTFGKLLDAGLTGMGEFANASGLGIPQATGMTPGADNPQYAEMRRQHPIAAGAGQIAGLMNPANPANMAAGGTIGALGPATSAIGRIGRGVGEGALAGGIGAGTITAAGGGSGDQVVDAAATGAGVGGILGGVGRALQEPGRWIRGLLQSRQAPAGPGGQMLPPPGPAGAGRATPPLDLPDLEVPPRPEPVPSAAPHEPTEPLPDLSTIRRPGPNDTGMGAEEARRALDSEAMHMANRSAAVGKLVDIIPPGADSRWLGRMTEHERQALAEFVGVTQATDDTWRAVGDALDARAAGPSTVPAAPLPRESELARVARLKNENRYDLLRQRAPLDSASPTAPLAPTNTPVPPIPGSPRLPNINPDMAQMALQLARRGGMGHGPLGIDPMLGMLLQSPQFVNATGMAAGTKVPPMTNRQPGRPPIDLLNLYGM